MSFFESSSSHVTPIPVEVMPRHVAMIMDGNGRWAQQRGLPRVAGHRRGVKTVCEIIEQARKWNLKVLTLYTFSDENWGRPFEEVSVLMYLLEHYIKKQQKELHAQNIRLKVIGEISKLPLALQDLLNDAVEMLADNTGMTLNLALSYGGRAEITRAMRSIGESIAKGEMRPEDITPELITTKLDTFGLPDPDLVIRTSGEQRISNFLLWQSAYAELYFTDIFWPDFNPMEFAKALQCYALRKRRFGLTDAQIACSSRPKAQDGQELMPC